MNEQPRTASGRSLAWFAANGLVALVLLIGLSRMDRGAAPRSPAASPAADRAAVQLRAGVWETRSSLYGGTPTRALFRLPSARPAQAQALAAEVWREFDRIGRIFSPFDATTEVGKLNALPGPARVALSPELAQVLAASFSVWRASGGAFDPTIWPLRSLWHDAVKRQRVPSDAEIAATLRRVGLGRLQLTAAGAGTSLDLPEGGVQLDFGGIAKGYATDRVRAVLQRAGVQHGLVALGGEICTFGDDDGKPWRIGVQHPRDDRALWGVVTLRGELRVSTSGNYQQPLRIGATTYYHILDPRTGRPVSTEVESVTTLDTQARSSNMLLDAAATAIAVLGPDAGLALAQSLGIDVLMLVRDQSNELREVMTPGFRAHFERDTASENHR